MQQMVCFRTAAHCTITKRPHETHPIRANTKQYRITEMQGNGIVMNEFNIHHWKHVIFLKTHGQHFANSTNLIPQHRMFNKLMVSPVKWMQHNLNSHLTILCLSLKPIQNTL